MEDAQGAVAAGKEDQTSAWIKGGIIDAPADREAIYYFSRAGIHHNHLRLLAATDEQAVRFSVIGKTGRGLGHADGKTVFDLERFRIEDDDLGSVLAVEIDKTVLADDSLFAVAAHLHRADDVTGRGIDGADIVRAVIICVHAFRALVVVDAVRALAYIDLLNELQ